MRALVCPNPLVISPRTLLPLAPALALGRRGRKLPALGGWSKVVIASAPVSLGARARLARRACAAVT
eukprot:6922327-Alexandrium_andersonii.AAC.1